jgi:hypothetical protein
MQATPRKILQNRSPAVLPCDDMVDLERQWVEYVGDPTIVAAALSEPANLGEQRAIHEERLLFLPFCFNDRRAFDFRMPSVWPTRM